MIQNEKEIRLVQNGFGSVEIEKAKLLETIKSNKEKHVKEYNEAIKDGHKAFLMEKVDGDTFSICIGNLPPMADVKIQIRCCLELSTEIDSTNVRLCIPMTIMGILCLVLTSDRVCG